MYEYCSRENPYAVVELTFPSRMPFPGMWRCENLESDIALFKFWGLV
jgi:hypothetical protein